MYVYYVIRGQPYWLKKKKQLNFDLSTVWVLNSSYVGSGCLSKKSLASKHDLNLVFKLPVQLLFVKFVLSIILFCFQALTRSFLANRAAAHTMTAAACSSSRRHTSWLMLTTHSARGGSLLHRFVSPARRTTTSRLTDTDFEPREIRSVLCFYSRLLTLLMYRVMIRWSEPTDSWPEGILFAL